MDNSSLYWYENCCSEQHIFSHCSFKLDENSELLHAYPCHVNVPVMFLCAPPLYDITHANGFTVDKRGPLTSVMKDDNIPGNHL